MRVIAIDRRLRPLRSSPQRSGTLHRLADGAGFLADRFGRSLRGREGAHRPTLFFHTGEAVCGPGLIVGHDNHGGVLPAPTMSEDEVAKAVGFGSAPVPFVKKHRHFPGIE